MGLVIQPSYLSIYIEVADANYVITQFFRLSVTPNAHPNTAVILETALLSHLARFTPVSTIVYKSLFALVFLPRLNRD